MSVEMNNTVEAEDNFTVDLEDSESQQPAVDEKSEQMFASDSEGSDEGADSGELENYSENVQKRINQLTAKRKQAIEEAEAAYQYAQQVQNQNEEMKRRLQELDQGYINEYGSRVESQLDQAKRLLKEARDIGDIDKEMEAQDLLARLAIERERLRVQKARQEQAAQQPQEQQAQMPQRQQAPRQEDLDPKLQTWLGKNENWFGKDMVMTRGAQAIHETLVGAEGYDPTSDEYYAEIDRRMRREFPHKFQAQRQNAQAVAPASTGRSVKSGRKKTVELTPGQVAFAKKMNIPLERYAKEVAKLEKGA
jgi:DNA repair exonuclease SbcCD ATPase subunit